MAVSPPRLPDLPLNALRAFEAAARLGGFAAAAAELGVTPGAVTAHVKQLEAVLGAALFAREARGVVLTPLGARVLPDLSAAFDALSQAGRRLRAEARPRHVHIATLPAIAQLWLSPRLPDLRAASPEISISITAMEAPPNLKRAGFDLCLFPAQDQGTLIADDRIFPVCAPGVAARLRRVEDLADVACLTDASWRGDWGLWLAGQAAGVVPSGPVFSLYALALEEAVNGGGVLMGHSVLVERHLADGRLVRPFSHEVRLPAGLRLWSARPLRGSDAAGKVARWLSAPS
jgi:DNA-binding transcriptional LysR family regulator